MPTYDYVCSKCGHQFELFQSIKEEPKRTCPKCKGRVKRLIGSGAGLLFKGSGFYLTDYRSEGYSKQKIREYVYQHARVAYKELEFVLKYGHSEAFTIPDAVERGLYPQEYLGGGDKLLRVLPSPDVINIVVCGDPNRNRLMLFEGGHAAPSTRAIRPA